MRRDLTVNEEGSGRILRAWLSEKLQEVPSKGIRRAIQRGQVTVDGQRVSSSSILRAGQKVSVHIQDKFNAKAAIPELNILFEDDHIAALFKPEGIEIHGSHQTQFIGVVKQIVKPSQMNDALLNPVILHRLDKPTCGVLLIAKTRRAVKSISDQFQGRTIRKQYLAVVHGTLESELTIEQGIEGKEAISTVSKDPGRSTTIIENGSVVHVFPKTGRRHQIRRHLASNGFPVVGDKAYGVQGDKSEHLLLCAEAVSFVHPDGSVKEIRCEVPRYFGLV
jgi:RluA family pseudouridine synthase